MPLSTEKLALIAKAILKISEVQKTEGKFSWFRAPKNYFETETHCTTAEVQEGIYTLCEHKTNDIMMTMRFSESALQKLTVPR